MPMPRGKATARPATPIAATSSRFAALKMMPPAIASRMCDGLAAARAARNTCSPPPQREPQGEAGQQHADDIVPIEELERPARGEVQRIGPGAPAEHAEQHESQLRGVAFRFVHGASLLVTAAPRFMVPAWEGKEVYSSRISETSQLTHRMRPRRDSHRESA